jgi:SRSO17 transposase
MKEELGLDHFEGRGWRGFHHHAAMVILAYGFLLLEQARPRAEPTGSGKKGRSRNR